MIELNDDGYETVILREGDTVACEKRIDLWAVNNQLAEIQRQTKDKPATEFHQAIVDYLKELGFPPVSHRFADRFAAGVVARVRDLKNAPAGAPSPGSPASMASTPSA